MQNKPLFRMAFMVGVWYVRFDILVKKIWRSEDCAFLMKSISSPDANRANI